MPSDDRLRILVADDHALFRRGVRDAFLEAHDLEVVAEAADGEQAVEMSGQLRPEHLDLVLMDLSMPKLDGIAATRRILAEDPTLPVVVLTVSGEEDELLAAMRAGAVGFLSKGLTSTALIRTLRDFHRDGALPMSRTMAARVLRHLQSLSPSDPVSSEETTGAMPPVLQSLTGREREVLMHIALGERDWEIASRLQLTENTVKKHVKNILQKLGVRNRAQAAARSPELASEQTRYSK
jgi:DNA-binding NarL/FixJ family response regulator